MEYNKYNLTMGQEFKNFKTLCEKLGLPTGKGNTRKAVLRELSQYYRIEKVENSIKIRIEEIYEIPIEAEDGRGKNPNSWRNGGLYQKQLAKVIETAIWRVVQKSKGDRVFTNYREIIRSLTGICNDNFFLASNYNLSGKLFKFLREESDGYYSESVYKEVVEGMEKSLKEMIKVALKRLKEDGKIEYEEKAFKFHGMGIANKSEADFILNVEKTLLELNTGYSDYYYFTKKARNSEVEQFRVDCQHDVSLHLFNENKTLDSPSLSLYFYSRGITIKARGEKLNILSASKMRQEVKVLKDILKEQIINRVRESLKKTKLEFEKCVSFGFNCDEEFAKVYIENMGLNPEKTDSDVYIDRCCWLYLFFTEDEWNVGEGAKGFVYIFAEDTKRFNIFNESRLEWIMSKDGLNSLKQEIENELELEAQKIIEIGLRKGIKPEDNIKIKFYGKRKLQKSA